MIDTYIHHSGVRYYQSEYKYIYRKNVFYVLRCTYIVTYSHNLCHMHMITERICTWSQCAYAHDHRAHVCVASEGLAERGVRLRAWHHINMYAATLPRNLPQKSRLFIMLNVTSIFGCIMRWRQRRCGGECVGDEVEGSGEEMIMHI